MQNVVDFAAATGAWFALGFAFYSSSGNAFAGSRYWFLDGASDDPLVLANAFLALTFASSAVTIVSGAIVERCRLIAYVLYSLVMATFIYPLGAHWCELPHLVLCLVQGPAPGGASWVTPLSLPPVCPVAP